MRKPLACANSPREGRWSRFFWLAYDKEVYYPPQVSVTEATVSAVPRIALYARRGTARRAVELALLALEHLARKGVDFCVLFGEDLVETRARFRCTCHGVLKPEQLAALYLLRATQQKALATRTAV
jgi:hypothetical protein